MPNEEKGNCRWTTLDDDAFRFETLTQSVRLGLLPCCGRGPSAAGLARTPNRPGSQRVVWPEGVGVFQSASACSRAADGDRPRPGLPRAANRPGSQRVVWPEGVGVFQSASACSRAADGDRPRPGLARTANRPGSQRVVWPEGVGVFQSASACSRAADGDRPRPACLGPRTVPVRSGLSGLKASAYSRVPRPAHALRTETVRGPSEAQDAVVIAKSSAAPSPILGVPDQICLGRIALDVAPRLQFVLGIAHECVPVIVRPKLAAAAQLLVRLARRVFL